MLAPRERPRIVHRVKGRPVLLKRLRALLLAVHRFGRGRAQPCGSAVDGHAVGPFNRRDRGRRSGPGPMMATSPRDGPLTATIAEIVAAKVRR
jgi:hypothetical protein